MAETFCDSGAVKYKAGANASTTITGDPTALTQFINQAESDICVATKVNFLDSFASLNADVKKMLEDAASSKAACYVITYDPSGYTNLAEASFIADINWATYQDIIRLLKDKDYSTYLSTA